MRERYTQRPEKLFRDAFHLTPAMVSKMQSLWLKANYIATEHRGIFDSDLERLSLRYMGSLITVLDQFFYLTVKSDGSGEETGATTADIDVPQMLETWRYTASEDPELWDCTPASFFVIACCCGFPVGEGISADALRRLHEVVL